MTDGGECMDKKDLEAISQIVKFTIEDSNKELREEIKQSNETLRSELREEIKHSNETLKEEFREEMKQSNEVLRKEFREDMNAFEKRMLDRMFLFEQEYGKKIDVIFDVAVMQKDKAQEMYKNQEKFRIQVGDLDTKVFDLEQRVFKLEHP